MSLEADRRHLALDLGTSYLASITRVAANAAIVAMLFRLTHPHYVAAFVLVRAMLSVITYTFAGWQAAALRMLESSPTGSVAAAVIASDARPAANVIDYRASPPAAAHVAPSGAINLLIVSALAVLCIYPLLIIYSDAFISLHGSPITRSWVLPRFVLLLAIGMLWRSASEPAGAILQSGGRMWLDNLLVASAEVGWVALSLAAALRYDSFTARFGTVAEGFWVSGAALFAARWIAAVIFHGAGRRFLGGFSLRACGAFLMTGCLLAVGHFADFLYAPANIYLINEYLSRDLLDEYGPALQIDAALLLTVSAISAVALPRVARAATHGDLATIRRIYVFSMALCLALLVTCALIVVIVRRPLLHLWLGEAPGVLVAILPLVLLHTVIGGTAGVGRAVLLGMGRFKAYTLSALVGGIVNVTLALTFVLHFDLGLRGIVFATIIAVTLRCAIWMPWYILKSTETASGPLSPVPGERE